MLAARRRLRNPANAVSTTGRPGPRSRFQPRGQLA